MKNSIKNFLLESESNKNEDFAYIDGSTIGKIDDIDFNQEDNYIIIHFSTTYNKKMKLVSKLSDFKKWLSKYLKDEKEKASKLFIDYLIDFFESSEESKENINEIIDDTNEIMPDDDMPSNASNRLVGTDQRMDLEKVFKRSMPKSIRNYSGNLGLGTVVW